jgi:hypothetical protein
MSAKPPPPLLKLGSACIILVLEVDGKVVKVPLVVDTVLSHVFTV